MPTPESCTLDKGLRLLAAVIERGRGVGIPELASVAELPPSTAHRLMAALHRRGFVAKVGRGDYLPGPALMRLGRAHEMNAVLREVSRSLLNGLSRRTGLTTHLGVLEGDMVTYLVKSQGRTNVLTQEGSQLEAYCSGIGKVLLAALPDAERERYLSAGPFVPMTSNTIVDPDVLRHALSAVRSEGRAIDDREVAPDLRCIAVPVRSDNGVICAAISISAMLDQCGRARVEDHLESLIETARRIEGCLARHDGPPIP